MTRLRWVALLGGAALVLGGLVLRASIPLDVLHVVIGAAAVVARPRAIGVASLGLWLLGVAGAGAWLSLDLADNWLHVGVAAGLFGLSLLVGGEDLADDLEGDLGGRLASEA